MHYLKNRIILTVIALCFFASGIAWIVTSDCRFYRRSSKVEYIIVSFGPPRQIREYWLIERPHISSFGDLMVKKSKAIILPVQALSTIVGATYFDDKWSPLHVDCIVAGYTPLSTYPEFVMFVEKHGTKIADDDELYSSFIESKTDRRTDHTYNVCHRRFK